MSMGNDGINVWACEIISKARAVTANGDAPDAFYAEVERLIENYNECDQDALYVAINLRLGRAARFIS